MRLLLALSASAIVTAGPACTIEPNYLDPDGPRYVCDYTSAEPDPGGPLRVVSYNLAFGRNVPAAIAALETGPLAGADLVLMQEMDAPGVDQIAKALGLRYVYYPASVKHDQDWGNAVLSRWPLVEDHKLLLPYADPFSNSRRIATAARIDIGGREALIYSTHIATPSLGLGARLEQLETIIDDAGDAGVAGHTGDTCDAGVAADAADAADTPDSDDATDAAFAADGDDAADASDLPVLIGGDLNTADPGSAGQVRDLFAGRGFAWASKHATDTGSAFGFDATLDYVFARGLEPQGSGTFAGDSGSDHQPIWVELAPP